MLPQRMEVGQAYIEVGLSVLHYWTIFIRHSDYSVLSWHFIAGSINNTISRVYNVIHLLLCLKSISNYI